MDVASVFPRSKQMFLASYMYPDFSFLMQIKCIFTFHEQLFFPIYFLARLIFAVADPNVFRQYVSFKADVFRRLICIPRLPLPDALAQIKLIFTSHEQVLFFVFFYHLPIRPGLHFCPQKHAYQRKLHSTGHIPLSFCHICSNFEARKIPVALGRK